MIDKPIEFDANALHLFRKEVIDIIDCIVEDGKVSSSKLDKDIYGYIMLDVKDICLEFAKQYMKDNGYILEVDE